MITPPFANLADAGTQLGHALLRAELPADALLLGVSPNGPAVAAPAARVTGFEAGELAVHRSAGAVSVTGMPDVSGRTVLVVDDGVETGSVARAAVQPLRDAGAAFVVLAVPVLPDTRLPEFERSYDAVVATIVSTGDASLASHFVNFDAAPHD